MMFSVDIERTTLMDEPFAALDALTPESLQDELARIHATTSKTVMFVMHPLDETVYLADEIVAIKGTPGAFEAVTRVAIDRPRRRGAPGINELTTTLRANL